MLLSVNLKWLEYPPFIRNPVFSQSSFLNMNEYEASCHVMVDEVGSWKYALLNKFISYGCNVFYWTKLQWGMNCPIFQITSNIIKFCVVFSFPYIHKLSQLQKTAQLSHVKYFFFFSMQRKWCPDTWAKNLCKKRHQNLFWLCALGVTWSIPCHVAKSPSYRWGVVEMTNLESSEAGGWCTTYFRCKFCGCSTLPFDWCAVCKKRVPWYAE